ncbi:MAG: hypothetical protein ACJ768_18020 [Gaiellaceae bacterium]
MKDRVTSLARRALGRRVAAIFDMDVELAGELLAEAYVRQGRLFLLRSTAFVVATAPLSRHLVPRALRERAITAFVWWLFGWDLYDPRLTLAYTIGSRKLLPS